MDVFTAVADPARREVMSALARGDLSAGEIAALFPISRPAVSRHKSVRLDCIFDPQENDHESRFHNDVRRHLVPDELHLK